MTSPTVVKKMQNRYPCGRPNMSKIFARVRFVTPPTTLLKMPTVGVSECSANADVTKGVGAAVVPASIPSAR
jgi:hypothetical protein